jgi:hypothetical protein
MMLDNAWHKQQWEEQRNNKVGKSGRRRPKTLGSANTKGREEMCRDFQGCVLLMMQDNTWHQQQ